MGNNSPEYFAWGNMIQRCTNPKHPAFHHYGARGITVCKRWRESFENFLTDMGRRPSSSHSLERRNNDLGYDPSNCVWATCKEQSDNRRCNVTFEHEGRVLTQADLARTAGIPVATLHLRLKEGLPLEAAIQQGRRGVKRYSYNGANLTIKELVEISGLTKNQLLYRLNTLGMTVEEVLTKKA